MRVGHGFDSHPYRDDPTRPLILGGVVFDSARCLVGHSDADVVAHACADALLGPAGLGDIGSWFPDDDPTYAGANSIGLLETVAAAVRDVELQVVNIDCSIVAQEPKLAPRRDEMQERLSAAVGGPVTINGKRPEGLGEIDGVMCWAVALLESTT